MVICPNKHCKHKNPDNGNYCSNCGTNLEERFDFNNHEELYSKDILNNVKKTWSSIKKEEKQIKKIDRLLYKTYALNKRQYIRCHLYEGDINKDQIAKAYNSYLEYALKGNSVAENAIGMFYETGIYVQKDLLKAKEWYQSSSKHNCYYGYNNLALLYLNGDGCEKNIDKAIDLFEIAANSGFAQSQYYLSVIYYFEKNYKDNAKALFWIQKAAPFLHFNEFEHLSRVYSKIFTESSSTTLINYLKKIAPNNLSAKNVIGIQYVLSGEIPNNTKKAVNSIKKGILMKNPESIYTLGLLCLLYENLIPDNKFSNSIKLLKEALNQGEYNAAYWLAEMNRNGIGFPVDYSKSIELHELASSNGIADSSYVLGLMYQYGEGVEEDKSRAFNYLIQAVKNWHIPALAALGDCFRYGWGTEKDLDKAIDYYARGADLGDVDAMNSLSYFYLQQETFNEELALKYAKMSAENQDSAGLNNYAYALENACSDGRYIDKAIELYSDAYSMDNTNILALKNLGFLYLYKLNDYHTALRYIEEYLSFSSEDGSALYALGQIFQYGPKGINNVDRAIEIYKKALDQKEFRAAKNLGDIYYEKQYEEEDYSKSIMYYSMASDNGIDNASLILGYFYEDGIGVKKNIQTAIKYYTKAANNADALYSLGDIFYEGKDGIEKNVDLAIEYYDKAAKLGEKYSSAILCYIYTTREYVDIKKAIMYADIAAKNEIYDGYFFLGKAFELGIGCEKNFDKAIDFYQKSRKEDREEVQESLLRMYFIKNDYEKVHKTIERLLLINSNNAFAYLIKGSLYKFGLGVDNNYEKAFSCFQKSISLGNDDAYYDLALMYAEGLGCNKDIDKALDCIKKIHGEFGCGINYFIGNLLYRKGNYKNAEHHLIKAIEEENDAEAYTVLGNIYRIRNNYTKAIEYYDIAIQKGDLNAKMYKAVILLNKNYIKPNYSIAKEIFRQLADECDTIGYLGYFGLGLLSELGHDTETPFEDAKKYFDIAANEPECLAYYHLARIYRLYGKDLKKAKEYYLKDISINNYYSSALELAQMLETDLGAENGFDEIIKLYYKVLQIDPNNDTACICLTRLFARKIENAINIDNSYIISKSMDDTNNFCFDYSDFLNRIIDHSTQ